MYKRQCLQMCLKTCLRHGPAWPRIAWITDTLHLSDFYVSESLAQLPAAEGYQVSCENTPHRAVFDAAGNFVAFEPF